MTGNVAMVTLSGFTGYTVQDLVGDVQKKSRLFKHSTKQHTGVLTKTAMDVLCSLRLNV